MTQTIANAARLVSQSSRRNSGGTLVCAGTGDEDGLTGKGVTAMAAEALPHFGGRVFKFIVYVALTASSLPDWTPEAAFLYMFLRIEFLS
jgi:hypothetical protein